MCNSLFIVLLFQSLIVSYNLSPLSSILSFLFFLILWKQGYYRHPILNYCSLHWPLYLPVEIAWVHHSLKVCSIPFIHIQQNFMHDPLIYVEHFGWLLILYWVLWWIIAHICPFELNYWSCVSSEFTDNPPYCLP